MTVYRYEYVTASCKAGMVRPGMASGKRDVGRLGAPLRWAVGLTGGASVQAAEGPLPPRAA